MSDCVIGVGVDLVDVGELDQLLGASRGAFLEAAWTFNEVAQCAGQSDRLAACWAAKEAAMKSLGIGIGDIDPLEVEVDMQDQRQPVIHLLGSAATALDRKGVTALAISVARGQRWAIAAAIAIGKIR